ncbi:uncharacterized protein TNCT_449921 [Trichonephila clavata]|uniref:DDE Tnp4 domain-containing protein n=1 Tax=Trichonephila clavata TaxID=2740835 RepID=A0A8X6LDD0_TRICU|nr:uncharacterized protein TNCT_449921 [Trichonephila clavata]
MLEIETKCGNNFAFCFLFGKNRSEPSFTKENLQPIEIELRTTSVGTQTESFGDFLDMLSEKDNALKEVNSRLEKEKFIPENIRDDTKMKALTSFTIKEFFCIYRFLKIEDDLSILTVSRDFNLVTDVLHDKLKLQDVFPTKDEVIRYMPPPFRMHCKNVRIIVDCTEFEIQKPASPMEQQMTFSHYKNANTFKGMIGITPNGAISFIYGSIPDKELVIGSKLMDRLEPNDVVMADKGFF